MDVDFAASRQSSVGLEWEMAIVDRHSLEQVPGAEVVLEQVSDPNGGPIRGEFLDSMIELVSAAHLSVAAAEQELAHLLEQVLEWLEPHGLTVLPVGAHPFGDPTVQMPRDSERYERVMRHNGSWGRQMALNGFHVHIGVDDRDKALSMVTSMARLSCYFIALSASSCLWLGEDTEFASQRTMVFQQLSSVSQPYRMRTWQDYENYVAELKSLGIIDSTSEIRWDVRPSKWGTVENRLMDSVPTVWEVGAVAALTQCLAEYISRSHSAGEHTWKLSHWLMTENKWRAARYGMDAVVVDLRMAEGTVSISEGLDLWLTELADIADELGCAEQLHRIRELATGGPSYLRQRRIFDETGDPRQVVEALIAETLAGVPDFSRRSS